jgi:peptide/nickel transport system permease protein
MTDQIERDPVLVDTMSIVNVEAASSGGVTDSSTTVNPPSRSLGQRVGKNRTLRRLRRNRAFVTCLAFVLFLVVVAVFANQLMPFDPNEQDYSALLQGPGRAHWLGTDALGRDTLSRLIIATRITLIAALEGLGTAAVLGLPTGLLAGYSGKWIGAILTRIFDALLSMPGLVLALAIVGMLGPGLTNAMIAIGVVTSPRFFRVARAAALSTSQENYIEACRAGGASRARILWRHVLPNSSGPLLVQTSFGLGLVVGSEAGLSYLGLGVQVPQASWGSMLKQAFDQVSANSFPLIPPSLALVLAIGAFFVIGDGLRDALGRDKVGS